MLTDILKTIAIVAAMAFGVALVASFTYFPMRDNYRGCGSIFLCHPQR